EEPWEGERGAGTLAECGVFGAESSTAGEQERAPSDSGGDSDDRPLQAPRASHSGAAAAAAVGAAETDWGEQWDCYCLYKAEVELRGGAPLLFRQWQSGAFRRDDLTPPASPAAEGAPPPGSPAESAEALRPEEEPADEPPEERSAGEEPSGDGAAGANEEQRPPGPASPEWDFGVGDGGEAAPGGAPSPATGAEGG
ncbi:unnamed protein product, partial [Prorocentrum cordatum]